MILWRSIIDGEWWLGFAIGGVDYSVLVSEDGPSVLIEEGTFSQWVRTRSMADSVTGDGHWSNQGYVPKAGDSGSFVERPGGHCFTELVLKGGIGLFTTDMLNTVASLRRASRVSVLEGDGELFAWVEEGGRVTAMARKDMRWHKPKFC